MVVEGESRTAWGRRWFWAVVFSGLVSAFGSPLGVAAERVSTLGRYQGYSEAVYDGWGRTSQHVLVRDGTRIAIDVFRPTNKGVLHEEPLSDDPVELVFDLLSTTQHFKAGHRIRVAFTGAGKDSYRHRRPDSVPTIRLLRDAQHRSHVIRPVLE